MNFFTCPQLFLILEEVRLHFESLPEWYGFYVGFSSSQTRSSRVLNVVTSLWFDNASLAPTFCIRKLRFFYPRIGSCLVCSSPTPEDGLFLEPVYTRWAFSHLFVFTLWLSISVPPTLPILNSVSALRSSFKRTAVWRPPPLPPQQKSLVLLILVLDSILYYD